ncbi:MAG: hypothetical protein R2862_12600 [Thermoanaerobaculia bacterium]
MQKLGNAFVKNLSAITGGTLRSILGLFVLLYAMFFFLIPADRSLLDGVLAFLPLPSADKERLVGRFLSVAKATLKGTLVVGLVQAILAGVAFAPWWGSAAQPSGRRWCSFSRSFRESAHRWSGSRLPSTSPPPATEPPRSGSRLWCAVVVGTIDNLLRPRLVGSDARCRSAHPGQHPRRDLALRRRRPHRGPDRRSSLPHRLGDLRRGLPGRPGRRTRSAPAAGSAGPD